MAWVVTHTSNYAYLLLLQILLSAQYREGLRWPNSVGSVYMGYMYYGLGEYLRIGRHSSSSIYQK